MAFKCIAFLCALVNNPVKIKNAFRKKKKRSYGTFHMYNKSQQFLSNRGILDSKIAFGELKKAVFSNRLTVLVLLMMTAFYLALIEFFSMRKRYPARDNLSLPG